jgi:hypothetical protein
MDFELAALIWAQARTARQEHYQEFGAPVLLDRDVYDHVIPATKLETCVHSPYEDTLNGDIVCTKCGLVIADKVYTPLEYTGATHTYTRKSIYKRAHHFNERIYQWTCRDPAVDPTILVLVKDELQNDLPITKTKIRLALRKHGGVKYIERWIQIYVHITNCEAPTPSSMQIAAMKEMFLLWEQAFMSNKPTTRKCIINYNFIFVRMLQCLNMTEHYKWFPMLKSKAKVRVLDGIWKDMCKSMGVEYLPLPSFRSLR